MKKLILGITIGILFGLFYYFIMTFCYSYEPIPNEFATVSIKNESGQRIKKILLKHNRGTIESTYLNNLEEIRFIFQNNGENEYNLKVTFENDSILNSQSVYFEYGYRGIEIIKKSRIITKNNWE